MPDDAANIRVLLLPTVISLGTMLVEIMRVDCDQPLGHIGGAFAGPFPSGDPAIYIDTVARLGHAAGYVGAVGDDDFGRCHEGSRGTQSHRCSPRRRYGCRMTPSAQSPQSEHPTRVPDIVVTFLHWTWMRALLHRGYWLVTSLYLVLDAGLSPFQLVLIGVAQAIVSLTFEVPTGVVADTISRKWSLVISHILLGLSMVATGLVTAFAALVATQILWGIAWTFASGADIAWITDELEYSAPTAEVLTAQARWQQIGAASGMIGFGIFAWATERSTAMVVAGVAMALLGLYVVAQFTEQHFTPTRTQRWRQATTILQRGVALARHDREILVVFIATFLVRGRRCVRAAVSEAVG
jgi:hypothetical protein